MTKTIAVVGGGAAGFFAAIRAAEVAKENDQSVQIFIFESGKEFLRKVSVSGGGRCNVTHHQFDVPLFCQNYPRGQKELRSPFSRFQAKDTVNWFAQRGVDLITEADGRMFPSTHRSSTVVNLLLEAAKNNGIQCLTEHAVTRIEKNAIGVSGSPFLLHFRHGFTQLADVILLATGSTEIGYELAASLGHTITERAPSLFSFKINHPLLHDLSGTSFSNASLKLLIEEVKKPFTQQGPLLITHWGLSGPGVLKISAWAAREIHRLHEAKQSCRLQVNWLGERPSFVMETLEKHQKSVPSQMLHNPFSQQLTKRFWSRVLFVGRVDEKQTWGQISKKQLQQITQILTESELEVQGKSRNKDEFVECGGVSLKEIDFKTMESKVCNGIFMAGEILDIDGITGGFNFQNAWSSGWIAGEAMVVDIE
jgi:predicted Rossmann fold flavoprotein